MRPRWASEEDRLVAELTAQARRLPAMPKSRVAVDARGCGVARLARASGFAGPWRPRTIAPRWVRAVRDYPRAAGGLGRPFLEAGDRHVPLAPLFPRQRTISDGRGYESIAWVCRTAAQRRLTRSKRRRVGRTWDPGVPF